MPKITVISKVVTTDLQLEVHQVMKRKHQKVKNPRRNKLRFHIKNLISEIKSDDSKIVCNAARNIRFLSIKERWRTKFFIQSDILSKLVRLLEDQSDRIVERTTAILSVITSGKASEIKAIVVTGALVPLIKCIKNDNINMKTNFILHINRLIEVAKDSKLQDCALWTFQNLQLYTRPPSNITIVSIPIMNIMLKTMLKCSLLLGIASTLEITDSENSHNNYREFCSTIAKILGGSFDQMGIAISEGLISWILDMADEDNDPEFNEYVVLAIVNAALRASDEQIW
ncbi:uncharacterized protein TRIADDRAFT_56213 [Trichoplax adhaerens]|uniref:IBB domain-containing protein n=1 Tax=Trichoplax adhaerens TaxID=10228 RepID=B3RXH7_TRIAD|nr:hypothetical protein TRIADDRAFT_56213 [Trichoplax adhaerens]EDV24860.1 hypothetical protein TRIADDRAFT_56213 [Trichoplax adhaerens]|eukprot:XP_002112750.1 hypothetical protein TRIADDRAFT_56213 [Trichoplax adhaerens]